MVGHLITLIIDAQQVIHAVTRQLVDDRVGLLTDRDVHHLGHGSVVVHVAIIGLVGTDRGSRWTPVTLSQVEEEHEIGEGVSGAVLLDLGRGRARATGCHEF